MNLEIPFSHYYYFNLLRLLRRDTSEQSLEFLFNNVSESSNDWLSIRYKHYLKKNKKIFFSKTPLNFTVQMFLKKIQGLPPEIRPFSDGPYSNDFKILSNNEHNILEFDNIKFYDYKKNRNNHRIIPIFNLVKDKFEIKFNNIDEYGSYRDIGSQYYRLIKEKEVNFMPKQGQNAMDVGCYIGHRAIAMSKLVGSKGVVYAIEAEENNFNLLKKNIYENNLKNIIPINVAVDDFPKKTFIYSRQKNSMAHGLRKFENIEDPSAIDIENRTQYKKEIQTTTISEVMSNYKISSIDMMHISVTGHEYEVINGIGS
ncbi:FkbM family methyltransferase, partial [Pelagibacteraceae bacterium]|nr:FkbM family methyltransferase [Pelagibacteraceae bacterium]